MTGEHKNYYVWNNEESIRTPCMHNGLCSIVNNKEEHHSV